MTAQGSHTAEFSRTASLECLQPLITSAPPAPEHRRRGSVWESEASASGGASVILAQHYFPHLLPWEEPGGRRGIRG